MEYEHERICRAVGTRCSLQVVVVARFLMELVSNRQRVLEGPKCSWVLPAASRLSFQSSGCSPRPPRSRSGDWWVKQAKDDAERGDVRASFSNRRRDRRDESRDGPAVGLGVWFGDVGEEASGSFRSGETVEAQD